MKAKTLAAVLSLASALSLSLFAHSLPPVSSVGNGTGEQILAGKFDRALQQNCNTPNSPWLHYKTDSKLSLGYTLSAASLQYEYGPAGFNQGFGIGGVQNANGGTIVLSNLSGNTSYAIYLRNDCGTSTSSWAGPFYFTTECTPVGLPFSENFNSYPVNCFENGGDDSWRSYFSPPNNRLVANLDQLLYGETASIESILIRLDTFALAEFDWSHRFQIATPDDALYLLARHSRQSTLDTLLHLKGQSNFDDPTATSNSPGQFVHQQLLLDTARYSKGDTVEFIFTAISGAGSKVFLDNFSVRSMGACPLSAQLEVMQITASSAQFQTQSYYSDSLRIEYGPRGFQRGSGQGTSLHLSAAPFSLSNLQPNTHYDVYLQSICPTDSSSWIGPITFKTDCSGALSGNYTIGPNPGPNNFSDLDSAIRILNECGVSGPVRFSFSGGRQYGGFRLGHISGASAINTIEFLGNPNQPDQIGQVELLGCQYVSFSHLHFKSTSGLVVRISNRASHISIERCTVESERISSSMHNAAIAFSSDSNNIAGPAYHGRSIRFAHNRILGGYAGLYIFGTPDVPGYVQNNDITIEGNIFEDQFAFGIFASSADSLWIRNNQMLRGVRSNTFTSYGIRLTKVNNTRIEANEIYRVAYGIHLQNIGQDTGINQELYVANNMLKARLSALVLSHAGPSKVYHNTAVGGSGAGLYMNQAGQVMDIRNNILMCTGSGPGLFAQNGGPVIDSTMRVDYNNYGSNGPFMARWAGNYGDLAAWKQDMPSFNIHSLERPVQFSANNNLRVLDSSVNQMGDTTLAIFVDIDSNSRMPLSGNGVDIGAHEYDPVQADLALIDINLNKTGLCLSQNDTIQVQFNHTIGPKMRFATHPLTIRYWVEGPRNSSGIYVLNSDSLDIGDTLELRIPGVDFSAAGRYSVQVQLDSSAINQAAFNDSLVHWKTFELNIPLEVYPKEVVRVNAHMDTVLLRARSPFASAPLFISEICQFKSPNGAPSGGWPSYLTADDHIEISGAPFYDIGGVIVEIYISTFLHSIDTLEDGALIGPDGTCVIMTGEGRTQSDPSLYLYDGAGQTASTLNSGIASGYVLRAANGTILDAVTYNGYTFPAVAGVSPSDWSGSSLTATNSAGLRLEGADQNDPSNWVVSTTSPQDPNVLNANVALPQLSTPPGFRWVHGGASYSTKADTLATNWTSSGVEYFIAEFPSPCGLLRDTVVVEVNLPCDLPNSLTSTVIACDSVLLSWNGQADSTLIEVVQAGSPPSGNTTLVTNRNFVINQGSPFTSYDLYLHSICRGDTLLSAGAFSFSIADEGQPQASYSVNYLSSQTVEFDASPSIGNGLVYAWNFGDGNLGVGQRVTHTYTSSGPISASLVVSNTCGSDTAESVLPISLEESFGELGLFLYPHPVKDKCILELTLRSGSAFYLQLLSTDGRCVLSDKLKGSTGKNAFELDLSGIASGIYVLQISTEGSSISKKLIVE